MVLSLASLCLVSLRDAIESERFPHAYCLPTKNRQQILDVVLMHGTIDNPNCLSTLSSEKFLSNFSSFCTQSGVVDDSNYLRLVASTIASILPNGEKLGSNISKLNLNLYCYNRRPFWNDDEIRKASFRNVVDLIAQCPNLISLSLQLIRDRNIDEEETVGQEEKAAGLLNRMQASEPCSSTMENLEELTLIGANYSPPFLTSGPILKFKQLTSLTLINAKVGGFSWRKFMLSVRDTLAYLHLEKISDFDDCILPYALPKLISIRIDNFYVRCDRFFFYHLMQCPKLQHIFLQLPHRIDDHKRLLRLSQAKIDLDLKIDRNFYGFRDTDDKILFDDPQLFDLLNKNIKYVNLDVQKWSPQLTTVLEQIGRSPNLISLQLNASVFSADRTGEQKQELQKAKSHLASLFQTKSVALHLKELSLNGEYDFGIVTSIFENCLNLESLSIADCPQLIDFHLRQWSRLGGELSRLRLTNCNHVTESGLIAILQNSNNRLIDFVVSPSTDISDRVWLALIEQCRFLTNVYGMPGKFKNLFHSKCFFK